MMFPKLVSISLIMTFILLIGCQGQPAKTEDNTSAPAAAPKPETVPTMTDFETLTSWMTGSFSSQEQAEQDTNYFDIRLEMTPIWPERNDAYWLYVEQAVAEYKDKPYRQRVYKVTQQDELTFVSAIYTMESPLRFAGEWQKKQPLATLTPDSLTLKEGCEVFLQRVDENTFAGKTGDQTCPSELRGAAFATSEVTITKDTLISWDRGFDAEGKHIWGAEQGGYIFKKIQPE